MEKDEKKRSLQRDEKRRDIRKDEIEEIKDLPSEMENRNDIEVSIDKMYHKKSHNKR